MLGQGGNGTVDISTVNAQRYRRLWLKLVANTFYGVDEFVVQFLPDFANVHVDGSVYHEYFIAPNVFEDFIAAKNATWARRQEGQQLKLFSG